MNQMTFNIDSKIYKRISKPVAKKLYNEQKELIVCAVKMRPGGVWGAGIRITKAGTATEIYNEESFDDMVNSFEYYNCTHETGLYASFYVPQKTM